MLNWLKITNKKGQKMKLKKALKIAKTSNFDYIAVDSNNFINMFKAVPTKNSIEWGNEFQELDTYTGSKNWKDTLRDVKKNYIN